MNPDRARRIRRALRPTLAGLRPPAGTLIVGPGETLVLRYDVPLSPAEVDQIKARVRADYPGLPLVIVNTPATAVPTCGKPCG